MSRMGVIRDREEIEDKIEELLEDKKRRSYGTNHGATRCGQLDALRWVLGEKELLIPGV